MDILKDIASPQSIEHFRLIVFVAAVSSIMFVPYTGFVLGSSFISLLYNKKGRELRNPTLLKFAHSLTDIALYNKSLITFLAVIPGLSILFSLTQLLQQTNAIAVSLAGFGFIFLLAGFILLYSYKYTFRVKEILESFRNMIKDKRANTEDQQEIESYRAANIKTHLRSGLWGTIFLGISFVLYISALSITANPMEWNTVDSFFGLILSFDVWVKINLIFVLSMGITGIGILFFSFGLDQVVEHDIEYNRLVNMLGSRLSVIALLILPVLIFLDVAVVTDNSLSTNLYVLAGFAALLLFLTGHFIYRYVKTSDILGLKFAFVAFLIAISVLIAGDFVTIETATQNHAALLAYNNDKVVGDLNSRFGLVASSFTGEDIYNTRCSSCHLFDIKKVGPPYFETVPKYKGNKEALVAFILNPVPKNPGYPAMANPGIKSVEADSVAAYLIRKVAEYYSKKDTAGNLPVE